MKNVLLISVRFHDGWYHGSGAIPSPARMFQALLAGAGISGPLKPGITSALLWLENQAPPIVAWPASTRGQTVINYVPNNDFDSLKIKGDYRLIGKIKAKKITSPLIFDHAIPFLFAWQYDDNNDLKEAKTICHITEHVYQLGRSVDMAWAWGEIIPLSALNDQLERYPGMVQYPSSGNGDVDCPTSGSLDSLRHRYAATSKRFTRNSDEKRQAFLHPPKPRWKKVSYQGINTELLFELHCVETSGFSAWPVERTTELVIAIRDTAAAKLSAALPDRRPDIQCVFIGRKPNGENNGPTTSRIRIIPLPSIGHPQADMQLRRVMVEIPGECPIRSDDIAWAFSGMRLAHPISGSPIDLIRSDSNKQLHFYGKGQASFVWQTVTPAALPEETRRRIDPGRKKAEAKTGEERYLEQIQAASAVYQALRHANINTKVISIKTQKEPFSLRGTRVEPFAEATRFSKHSLWHLDIEFETPVKGPLVIGNGRFMGLGLMKAVSHPKSVQAILLALSTPNCDTSALPHIRDTLPLAELLHKALVGRAGKGLKIDCPELTGQQEDGRYLRGGHRHAHILPLDLDNDKHLDHVLVYAKMGLGKQAQYAIRSLKQIRNKNGLDDLKVDLAGQGDIDSFMQTNESLTASIKNFFGYGKGSRTWISHTPTVMPRYIKKQGTNSIEGQIQAELSSRGLPNAVNIEVLKNESFQMCQFTRVRCHGGPPPPQDAGYALRLTLSKPIIGPLTLGYGAHFGLGLFVPSLDETITVKGEA